MAAKTSQRFVPFFNYPHVFTSQETEFMSIIQDVGRRGAFIMQQDLKAFEQHLAKFVGAKYALGVGNCTDGLYITLRAAGIGHGDEVIFCSHTMVATAAAIYFARAIPVPVECGPDHLIDPVSVEAAITPRTKAIMPTQLNGRTCDMDALQAIADQNALLIIEDAAQALGSRFKGKAAGPLVSQAPLASTQPRIWVVLVMAAQFSPMTIGCTEPCRFCATTAVAKRGMS